MSVIRDDQGEASVTHTLPYCAPFDDLPLWDYLRLTRETNARGGRS